MRLVSARSQYYTCIRNAKYEYDKAQTLKVTQVRYKKITTKLEYVERKCRYKAIKYSIRCFKKVI